LPARNYSTKEKKFLQIIRIGTFLTFVAINLKFIVVDIIKPLELFNILQFGGYGRHFEFHMPSLPDICGDILAIILFVTAYLFMNSTSVRDKIGDIAFGFCNAKGTEQDSLMRMRDYVLWGKNIFYLSTAGFLFYFFSKYVLTPCLEVFFFEETKTETSFLVLNIINNVIRLFADLILVYTYCKYIGASKHFKPVFYSFFFLRDLLFTNLLGFLHKYDLEIVAPTLDVIFPLLLIYAIISYIIKTKSEEKSYEVRHIT